MPALHFFGIRVQQRGGGGSRRREESRKTFPVTPVRYHQAAEDELLTEIGGSAAAVVGVRLAVPSQFGYATRMKRVRQAVPLLPICAHKFAKRFVCGDVLGRDDQKQAFSGEFAQSLRQVLKARADLQN